MPEATGPVIGVDTQNVKGGADALSAVENGEMFFNRDANAGRKPEYYIYLFNVSPIEHYIERSWGTLYSLGNGVSRRGVRIEACPEGAEYSKPYILPDIMQESYAVIPGLPEMAIRGEKGEFLAQDVLNPDQPFGNIDTIGTMNLANTFNEGTNLYAWGCFRTRNNPPKPEEIKKARTHWEKKANSLVLQGNQLAQQGKLSDITQPMRDAATYLRVNVGWNQAFRSTIECPGCGEFISPNLARHMPKEKCGYVLDWDKALTKGMATKAEYAAAHEKA